MNVVVRIRRPWFVLLFIIGAFLAACSGGSTATSPPEPPATSTSSVADATVSAEITATRTSTSAHAPPPRGAPLPAALVGEWSASTRESGALELVLTADGSFHQYGSSFDWRGTAVVRGARVTFTGADGKSSTYDWSISGGTLTLDGITYLKTDAGAGGALALVGSWMGMDDIYETLVFNDNGTFERRHDARGTIGGTFRVKGNSLTLQPAGGASTTVTFSVTNGILTLRASAGSTQYTRSF